MAENTFLRTGATYNAETKKHRNDVALSVVTVKLADNYATDAAAATGGIVVGQLYHNAGAVRIRLS